MEAVRTHRTSVRVDVDCGVAWDRQCLLGAAPSLNVFFPACEPFVCLVITFFVLNTIVELRAKTCHQLAGPIRPMTRSIELAGLDLDTKTLRCCHVWIKPMSNPSGARASSPQNKEPPTSWSYTDLRGIMGAQSKRDRTTSPCSRNA